MQAQLKSKSKPKPTAALSHRDSGRDQQRPTITHQLDDSPHLVGQLQGHRGNGNENHDHKTMDQVHYPHADAESGLRSELFVLREQSLDAFQALVCTIVRQEKERQAASPTLPSAHATTHGPTLPRQREADPHSLTFADALLLSAPSPPTHDPSEPPGTLHSRRTNKSHNHPSSSPSTQGSHSAATSLLQALSQKTSPSARRRHSFASLSSIASSSPSPSQVPTSASPTSANTPVTPLSPRASSGMMKSLRSRFRSNSISSPPPDSALVPSAAAESTPINKDSAPESTTRHPVASPPNAIALNASTTSMDLAFALASLLEDVTSLLATDAKPSSTDLARVQAAMDDLVVLVDRNRATPASMPSVTDTMCESPSASTHPDGMMESSTEETASVHTIAPEIDGVHASGAEKATPQAKEKRYSTEPPPYDAHDFHSTRYSHALHPLKKKASDKHLKSDAQSPSELELEKLVSTIERLNRRGRLDDQAVHLTTKQRDHLEDAAISARIDRLARGRFEDQRAVSSANEQTRLMAAITDSNQARSLANQRVEMSSQMLRRIELARLGHLADRLANSGRMEDQDAVPQRVRELDRLARELERLSRPSGMDSQRYTMTDAKEKDMFLSQMAHRVSRLTDCRMEDQAADGPGVRKAAAFREVDQVLDRMAALSSSHMMDGQRYHV